MKLAVLTDEIDNDLGHALEVMAEYGVTGVELRQIWDKNIVDAPEDYWRRAKDLIDARGMHVVGIASPFYKCDLPGEEVDGPLGAMHSASARGLGDQISVLERAIAAAKFFDTDLIRVFSFWKRGTLTPMVEDLIVDAFAEPVALAEREGVILGLENEHSCYLGTGAQTARVLEEIGSKSLRSIWDPGNAFFDGEKPFPTGYESIKDFIVHVHVKDAFVPTGKLTPSWTVVGEGAIDWAGQIQALRDSGYEGYLSLETHYEDGTKEAASRACLEGLIKLLGPNH
ncbi:MAG: Sugar phosphate isomerase/epimerase [Capsulimonas sp.]|nr:Sugar phosphate isomerase/epimerase [Capsulimonas sp.]